MNNSKAREEKAKAFIAKHHTMWTKVKFLGVFDTVAALGLPIKWMSVLLDKLTPMKFHSFELSESVIYARQALAINEERKTFSPVLWDSLGPGHPKDKMKQVWFCGAHTDVGGGYAEDDLANISLRWMMKEATEKGLLIYEKSDAFKTLLAAPVNPDGLMHNEQKEFPGKLFRKAIRNWNIQTHGEPCIHESVLQRKKNADNGESPAYAPWILQMLGEKKPFIEPY